MMCIEDTGDHWGQTVAECTIPDGTVVDEAMIRGGWAVPYKRGSDGRYQVAENYIRSNRPDM